MRRQPLWLQLEKAMPVNEQGLAELARTLTNRHFLDLVDACHLSYPEPSMDGDVLAALDSALGPSHQSLEVVDLRPDPAERLNQVTERLLPAGARLGTSAKAQKLAAMVLVGFDRLEGEENFTVTAAFRTRFQHDLAHRWVFLGEDRARLSRMFQSYAEPLYGASMDVTPLAWRRA